MLKMNIELLGGIDTMNADVFSHLNYSNLRDFKQFLFEFTRVN